MNCSPFSGPIFLGHPYARGRCSQGERVLYGRGPVVFGRSRESRNREAAGRANWPELCPEKWTEKGQSADSVKINARCAGPSCAEKPFEGTVFGTAVAWASRAENWRKPAMSERKELSGCQGVQAKAKCDSVSRSLEGPSSFVADSPSD
jgi:hypothetical protein